MSQELTHKQMPCNKTMKLVWRRDLQREQTTPLPLLVYDSLHPSPLCPFSLLSPKRFIPHMMYDVWYHIVNLLFFPFIFVIILKVSVQMVNWSQFHSSHLYYEKDWKLLKNCVLLLRGVSASGSVRMFSCATLAMHRFLFKSVIS